MNILTLPPTPYSPTPPHPATLNSRVLGGTGAVALCKNAYLPFMTP